MTDLHAANEKLKSAQSPWAEELSPAEQQALEDYKGFFGRRFNDYLREMDAADTEQRHRTYSSTKQESVHRLAAALDRAASPADMLLLRAVGQEEADFLRSQACDAVITSPAFVSTTIVRAVADKIAKADRGTVIELVARKGQKGVAYIHPFPKYRFRQYEVLLNLGTKLRVLRADEASIRLEIVDGDEAE